MQVRFQAESVGQVQIVAKLQKCCCVRLVFASYQADTVCSRNSKKVKLHNRLRIPHPAQMFMLVLRGMAVCRRCLILSLQLQAKVLDLRM